MRVWVGAAGVLLAAGVALWVAGRPVGAVVLFAFAAACLMLA